MRNQRKYNFNVIREIELIENDDLAGYLKLMSEIMKSFFENSKIFEGGIPEIDVGSCTLALQYIL